MNTTEQAHIEKLVQEFVDRVTEHVDSVRVFLTYPSNDGEGTTSAFTQGGGNLFAQQAQARSWLIRQDQYVIEDLKKDVRKGEGGAT